jgi:hypothetical protein
MVDVNSGRPGFTLESRKIKMEAEQLRKLL